MATPEIENSESTAKNASIMNTLFYMEHLSVKEIKIIEELAKNLANSYSSSYVDWKYNNQ